MPKRRMNGVDEGANVQRLRELTGALIQDALVEIRSHCSGSSEYAENRFRTAEYFLLEAPNYVDAAWEMLLIGNVRASLAISRWTLEAALNLLWVVSDPDKTKQRLTDLVGEALRQDASLREGLAKMWPHRAAALKQSASRARQIRTELGVVRTTKLDEMMKEAKPPDKPDWPDLYVHYRVCCAAAHPTLKVWERFKAAGEATVSAQTSYVTILTPDMAMWVAATAPFWLVSFACSLADTGNAKNLKRWWDAEVAPLLGN